MTQENNAKKPNKAAKIIETVLVSVIVAVTVIVMIYTLASVTFLDKNDRNLFGFKFFIVQSDSMAATHFDMDDIVIAREVKDIRTLKEGDIITFVSQDPDSYLQNVTHMIREVTTDTDGSIAFVTYGTSTNSDDRTLTTIVVGKYLTHIPIPTGTFKFLQSPAGYVLCVLVPFLILIVYQIISCVNLFRRYKKEQMAALNAEREKLEAERAESQRMMAELMALKAQLAAKDAAPQGEEKPEEKTEERSEEL